MVIQISWTEFKNYITNTNLKFLYVNETDSAYSLYLSYSGFILKCYLKSGTNEYTDFEDNYKADGNTSLGDFDDAGRPIFRQAAAKKGWSLLGHYIEFETSKLASVYEKDWEGTDRGDITIKFYNAQDAELTVQGNLDTDCVKTVVTLAPPYDYELIGGTIRQNANPGVDLRLWVVGGAPELGAAGVKEFIGGVNMCFITNQEHVEIDGRASKFMPKDTVGVAHQTNQLQFIIRHPAGTKHKLMVEVNYFRA